MRMKTRWRGENGATRGKKIVYEEITLLHGEVTLSCAFATDFVVCYIPLIGSSCDNTEPPFFFN